MLSISLSLSSVLIPSNLNSIHTCSFLCGPLSILSCNMKLMSKFIITASFYIAKWVRIPLLLWHDQRHVLLFKFPQESLPWFIIIYLPVTLFDRRHEMKDSVKAVAWSQYSPITCPVCSKESACSQRKCQFIFAKWINGWVGRGMDGYTCARGSSIFAFCLESVLLLYSLLESPDIFK